MSDPAPCDLDGLEVLITRPTAQADGLCDAVDAANGNPIRFPTVVIAASADKVVINRLTRAADYNRLIFVSTNAVHFAQPYLPQDQLPPVAAVGRATADALGAAGFRDVLIPHDGADSEALLGLEAMQNTRDQRILIVRGRGGRPLLGDTLEERGARVDYAEVYSRELPEYAPEQLSVLEGRDNIILTATSGEILDNLVCLLGSDTGLLEHPVVVISTRVAQMAQGLGFRHVVTADGASTEAIIRALCALAVSD